MQVRPISVLCNKVSEQKWILYQRVYVINSGKSGLEENTMD